VLTSGKVQCSPSSPCARAGARCAWLRVAPPFPSPALRAAALPAPGRDGESRLADRTGKLGLGHSGLDHRVSLWIECHGANRRPVAGLAAPASRVGMSRLLVEFVAAGQQRAVLPGMALRWVT
jgi:hypothetical protein